MLKELVRIEDSEFSQRFSNRRIRSFREVNISDLSILSFSGTEEKRLKETKKVVIVKRNSANERTKSFCSDTRAKTTTENYENKKKTSDTVNRKNSFENKFFFKILKGLGMLYKPKKSFWLLNIFMLINQLSQFLEGTKKSNLI